MDKKYGRTDDSKTISLRLCWGIIKQSCIRALAQYIVSVSNLCPLECTQAKSERTYDGHLCIPKAYPSINKPIKQEGLWGPHLRMTDQWSGTIYAILKEGIMGNIHVKLYEIWTSDSEGDVV